MKMSDEKKINNDYTVRIGTSGMDVIRLCDGDYLCTFGLEHDARGDVDAQKSLDVIHNHLVGIDGKMSDSGCELLAHVSTNHRLNGTTARVVKDGFIVGFRTGDRNEDGTNRLIDVKVLASEISMNVMRDSLRQILLKTALDILVDKHSHEFEQDDDKPNFSDDDNLIGYCIDEGHNVEQYIKVKRVEFNLETLKRYNVTYMEDNEWIEQCTVCDRLEYQDNMRNYDSEGNLCQACQDEMYTCDQCGYERFREDGCYGSGSSDYWYCSSDCLHDAGDCDCCDGDCDDEVFWKSTYKSMKMDDKTFDVIPQRFYGIEIETCTFDCEPSENVMKFFNGVPDGSISATELVSTKLCGDEGLEIIKDVMTDIKENNNAETDRSCGYHLHVDVSDYTKTNMKELYNFCKKNEALFFSMFHENRRNNGYCRSITTYNKEQKRYALSKATKESLVASIFTDDTRKMYKSNGGNIGPRGAFWRGDKLEPATEEEVGNDVARIARSGKYNYDARYVWANFVSVLRQNSIEIRLHSQTLNGNKIGQWAKLWTHIVDGIRYGDVKGRQYNLGDLISKFKTSNSEKKALINYYAKRIKKFKRGSDDTRVGYIGTSLSRDITNDIANIIGNGVIEVPVTTEELNNITSASVDGTAFMESMMRRYVLDESDGMFTTTATQRMFNEIYRRDE
jgi:hypothetical protein